MTPTEFVLQDPCHFWLSRNIDRSSCKFPKFAVEESLTQPQQRDRDYLHT